ncbi:MAG: hypothetical protein CM15mP93_12300 [Thiotrichaceae bacterium]|nr:MAG: hypothetical protein CM15mP93_12300 [Thiotrichaceae bacterium]
MMSPMSAEAQCFEITLMFLSGVSLEKKLVTSDLSFAEKVLEDDHYGLDKEKKTYF